MASNDSTETGINEEDAKEVKNYYEKNKKEGLVAFLEGIREAWREVPVNVAICGNSSTGKSTFINTIRNVKPDEKGGAAVNYRKDNVEPIPYPHPDKQKLKLWDLPRIGTRAFERETYTKNINFDKYDVFLVFSNTSDFTHDDVWFAQQVQRAKKGIFFVRTHIDKDLKEKFSKNPKGDLSAMQTEVLTKVREGVNISFKNEKTGEDGVYLISNFEIRKFDFPKLVYRLIDDLGDRKMEAMALTINILSKEVIKLKRKVLQKRVWIGALFAGLEATEQLIGLPYPIDLDLIVQVAVEYKRQFGLNDASLLRMARSIGVTVDILKKASSFKMNYSHLNSSSVKKLFNTLSLDVAEGITNSFLPTLGNVIHQCKCFGASYFVLNKLLDMMENDSQKMIEFIMWKGSDIY